MDKLKKLKGILERLGSVVVAFSGGVDSSFLLKVARDTLSRQDILAVTAVSDTYTHSEFKRARDFSSSLGLRHEIIFTKELDNNNFIKNPTDRCYYCKKELFRSLKGLARDKGFRSVVDASNLDDEKDFRPGSKAKKEFYVRSPLQEAGITKNDIRMFSRKLGLGTWNLPSMACLASRIPYGERISRATLKKIEKGEAFIRGLGVRQVRVRYHNNIARVEVEKKDIKRFSGKIFCDKIIRRLKVLGFDYIVLDLEGYRSGSLNEQLPLSVRTKK
jgi:uncharacterized protein